MLLLALEDSLTIILPIIEPTMASDPAEVVWQRFDACPSTIHFYFRVYFAMMMIRVSRFYGIPLEHRI